MAHGGRVHYFPIILCIWFYMSVILTYTIAVLMKHVEPIFPYISDTGTFVPESCIFGQLLNIGAILMAIVMYIRYINVKELQRITESENVSGLNTYSLYLGWTSALGVSIVANFQESNVMMVHFVGAIMAFGFGFIYQFMMWKTGKILNEHSRKLNNIRLILAITSMVGFLFCFGFAYLAYREFKGEDMTKWNKKNGGYSLHLLSTGFEWICASSTIFFLFTFYVDFRKIRVEPPRVEFLDENK